MEIEMCAVGGFSEVGRNMTALRIGNEVIILDMGFNIPEIVRLQEEESETSKEHLSVDKLIVEQAIPNDKVLKEWKPMVKAIVLGHCHMDHTGAVPYLANEYNVPIYGTPYTIEVLKATLHDDRQRLKNPLRVLNPNGQVKLSKEIMLEFVHTTHSTPQTVLVVLHTSEGAIVYGNDFKLDNHPIIGKSPNYARMKELGEQGVLLLICDALYSNEGIKTPPESVARDMLEDVLLHTDNTNKLVIATTFASHIARLKSIVHAGRKLNRKVVILGRSMNKYMQAAANVNLVDFWDEIDAVKYGDQVKKKLREIEKNPGKYLVVCTGHQGEPGAILSRMATGDLPYNFHPGDQVIFACKVIPAPINVANREVLEAKLKQKGVRMFRDIHVSGHLAREDHRDFIGMIKPRHIVPAQGDVKHLMPLAELATEMGYTMGQTVHVPRNGQFIRFV